MNFLNDINMNFSSHTHTNAYQTTCKHTHTDRERRDKMTGDARRGETEAERIKHERTQAITNTYIH